MAENSLDDFFAKKDKSKKKKNPDKTKKIKKKRDVDSSADPVSAAGINNPERAEAPEWNDFEEETEVDYSGLKIQNLQVGSRDDEEEKEEGAEGKSDDEEEDENGEKREPGATGPWNKSGAPSSSTQAAAPPADAPVKEEAAPVRTGKYVPPGVRMAMASGGGGVNPGPRRKKTAPDLHSDMDFPTLGAGPAEGDQREFQRVMAGNKMTDEIPGSRVPRLQLDNKYTALSSSDN